MKTINRDQLGNLRMVAGNEKKHSIIIDDDIVKKWVGMGWINLREATAKDKQIYPIAISETRGE